MSDAKLCGAVDSMTDAMYCLAKAIGHEGWTDCNVVTDALDDAKRSLLALQDAARRYRTLLVIDSGFDDVEDRIDLFKQTIRAGSEL